MGTVPLLVLVHFAHRLLTALPAPMLPMTRSDFSLDYTQSGTVVSAFSLAYGIGQLPAGWITDLVGARIVIMIGICGVAVAGFLVGLSPNYLILLCLMALAGLAMPRRLAARRGSALLTDPHEVNRKSAAVAARDLPQDHVLVVQSDAV